MLPKYMLKVVSSKLQPFYSLLLYNVEFLMGTYINITLRQVQQCLRKVLVTGDLGNTAV